MRFLRIECDRCGKVVMHKETHLTRGYLPLRVPPLFRRVGIDLDEG